MTLPRSLRIRSGFLLIAACSYACAKEAPRESVVRFASSSTELQWDEMPTTRELRQAESKKLSTEAAARFASGDRLGGVARLRRAVDLTPGDVGLRLELARAFVSLPDEDAALRITREALRIAPQHPEASALAEKLTRIKASRGEASAEPAAEPAKTPAKTAPAAGAPSFDAEDALLAGNALVERGQHKEAIVAFERALQGAPEHHEARFMLGVAHERAGDLRAAAAAWKPLADKGALDPARRARYEAAVKTSR